MLGASSKIGYEIALKFAPKNTLLYLSGKNSSSLNLIANKCLKNRAERVSVICSDLSYDSDQLFELLGHSPINLNINLISATFRIRGSNFLPRFLILTSNPIY